MISAFFGHSQSYLPTMRTNHQHLKNLPVAISQSYQSYEIKNHRFLCFATPKFVYPKYFIIICYIKLKSSRLLNVCLFGGAQHKVGGTHALKLVFQEFFGIRRLMSYNVVSGYYF